MIASLLVPAVLCAGAVAPAAAPPAADLGAQLDALVAPHFPSDQPGAVVLVRKGDRVLLRKGYGRASLDPAVAMAPEMVFPIGSITKQFTAAAIMLLVDGGKVSPGDELRKWVAEYPDHGHRITVEQLLTHTSGIPNLTEQPGSQALMNVDATHDQVLALFKDLPLDFTPGRQWAYSNSGYYLLGMIVERASGQSYAEFMAEKIFKPLGMEHTRYGDRGSVLPGGGRGYSGRGPSPSEAEAFNPSLTFAAGALISSVDDLAIWDRAISTGKLLKTESWQRVFTSIMLRDGSSTHYGFGWGLGEYEGHPIQNHTGAIAGFVSSILRLPDDQVVVEVLCNSSPAKVPLTALSLALAALAIGKPVVDPPVVAVKPAVLDQYAGIYARQGQPREAVRRLGNQLTVSPNGGPFAARPVPASDTTFFIQGTLVRYSFLRDAESGRVTGMEERDDVGNVEVYRRTDEPLPEQRTIVAIEPAVLERYVGEYEVQPGDTITVTREGTHLYAQGTGQPRVEVFPSCPTEFFLKIIDIQLTFDGGGQGPAQLLIVHHDGHDQPLRRVH